MVALGQIRVYVHNLFMSNTSFYRRSLDAASGPVIVWPSTPVPPRVTTIYPYLGPVLELACVIASIFLWVCAFGDEVWVRDSVLSRVFGDDCEDDDDSVDVRRPLLP